MHASLDLLFILVVVIDLFLLASSRLNAAINAVALQGALLSALAVLLGAEDQHVGHTILLALGALAVKAVIIPWLMYRAIRGARGEVDPAHPGAGSGLHQDARERGEAHRPAHAQ